MVSSWLICQILAFLPLQLSPVLQTVIESLHHAKQCTRRISMNQTRSCLPWLPLLVGGRDIGRAHYRSWIGMLCTSTAEDPAYAQGVWGRASSFPLSLSRTTLNTAKSSGLLGGPPSLISLWYLISYFLSHALLEKSLNPWLWHFDSLSAQIVLHFKRVSSDATHS